MSANGSSNLSFVCPQCQKKLKAPPSLVGKRVACPKCAASVVVPGPLTRKNEDDDWLMLDPPEPTPPSLPKLSVPALPVSTPVDAVGSADLDDLELEPIQDEKATNASTPNPKLSNKISAGESSSPRRSLFDDDLPDLVPTETDLAPVPPRGSSGQKAMDVRGNGTNGNRTSPQSKGKPAKAEPKKELPSIDLDDIALEPLLPPPKASFADQSAELLSSEDIALREYFQPVADEEFGFPCKVCGTLLYAKHSRVGTTTRCPDCFSEFSVPKPPVKKKKVEVQRNDELADVALAPLETAPRIGVSDKDKAKQILDQAVVAVENEEEETRSSHSSFDSKRWLSLMFGFGRDPGILIAATVLGIFTAGWFYALARLGTLDVALLQIWILRVLLFGALCIPILGSIAMCALAIIPMAANRKSRIEDWPIGKFMESLGETMMILVSIVIASIPGGIFATLMRSVDAHPAVYLSFLLVSIWGITPILLLCMIDNNKITEPYSKKIIQSFSLRPDAWGAMYMQTAFVFIAILFFSVAVGNSSTAAGVFGFVLPLLCFFTANQYGILAGRISDVTELGFEGDFSDD